MKILILKEEHVSTSEEQVIVEASDSSDIPEEVLEINLETKQRNYEKKKLFVKLILGCWRRKAL